jgi:alpha-beta hydrolase superfamily lysophospholipase
MPAGKPRGAVVLLHGLTDSPYSVRHLAVDYQQHGFVAVVPRLPGHGTAPGALTDVDWEMWLAATRLAVREATRLAGDNVPLHLVGYSNGGALAMKYALDALDSPRFANRSNWYCFPDDRRHGVCAFCRVCRFTRDAPGVCKSGLAEYRPGI